MRHAAVLCLLALVSAACSGEQTVFEGGPRFPDDEGVVTSISLERMQIEGDRNYVIGRDVESFKTRSHEPASLLSLKDKYVQVGLDGDEVGWIALVGIVVGDDSPTVLYTGVFDGVDGRTDRAVFADGTTLALADDIDVPEEGQEVAAAIDARSHTVTSLQVATLRTTPTP
ncbi:MAG: hypothetical protein ACREQY_12850 [Candidatus Binatia bacterium]